MFITRYLPRWGRRSFVLAAAVFAVIVFASALPPAARPASADVTCTTVCYADATGGNDANGGASPADAKKTIQAAINAVEAGGTVRVLPGAYHETAPGSTPTSLGGTYQFGLFFHSSKPGLTVMGVTAADEPITDAGLTQATVTTGATNSFGYSGVFIEAADTSLQGLTFGDNSPGNNKTIEVVADNFTLRHSRTAVTGGGAVYISDFHPENDVVKAYAIVENLFDDGTQVAISSGAGETGPVEGRVIANNTFAMGGADWPGISFNGTGGVAWFAHPVGGAAITGNDFSGSTQYIRARGTYNEPEFDWLGYWSNNTFDRAVVALVSEVPFDLRPFSYSVFTNVRSIGAVIQGEIANAAVGDVVLAGPGTYAEDLVISTSVTLKGSGQGTTTIVPSTSNPNPCAGSSTCGGAATNVILVSASDVTIRDLTVSGSNPALSGGIVVDGVEVHARNGIITNHAGSGYPNAGVVNDLEVSGVTVRDVFLRGIYASSGGTFNFHDNTVENVQGDAYAIGMFNFGGAGTFADNTVSRTSDGIASNWSRGTNFTGNVVTQSGSGIHTDNAGGNTIPGDLIAGNTVSDCKPDGYGIWVFVQYSAATVENNTVSGCNVGLGAFGGSFSGPTVETLFRGNSVTGTGEAGSIGVLVQTGTFGWGNTDVAAAFEFNSITGFETGVLIDESDDPYEPANTAGPTATVVLYRNAIAGNSNAGIDSQTANTTMATCNWFGHFSGPSGNAPGLGDAVWGNVDVSTWLLEAAPLETAPCGTPEVPTDPEQCKAGGWAALVREDGTTFLNQGSCVSYVKTDS